MTAPQALDPTQPEDGEGARDEVGRLYHQAFRDFGASALWNLRELDCPTARQALAMTRQLRIEGDMQARLLAEAIERACCAHN